MATDLVKKKCVACETGDAQPVNKEEAEVMVKQTPGWSVSDDAKWLKREFKFKDFAQALAFTDKVGAIAESEGHHPDIETGWGYVRIKLTTHAINGLFENDFIVAAKVNQI
jgi:4a-hydroxytetrahydrobiopterin dehydratase